MNRKSIKLLAPILWMILMFFISSQSVLPVVSTQTVDFISKKSAHIFEYIVLNLLWIFALGRAQIGSALLLSLGYAFFDETHQLFTPTRAGQIRDVGIDFIGIAISSLLVKVAFPWKHTPQHPSRKREN